ncbi:choline dehydrogenase [Ideonella dechloratans]|uniref:Choline dehydrogenase n=1 Tax=Ideonella dechloratans TaxID=36863 RepID=A0A643F879_IDEDE|nr:choline dehydrogenase [Ideonella dechloratans]KAB0577037.1 choline dehydrogenase [Ideonella dechloratans]UFU08496.1 choline dehydrogenase [Ideonella dechloratans]
MTPNQTFDYVIVGGGSAGSVLASRLSEDPAVSVALLEAGPADRSVLIHCPAGLGVMARTGQANWCFETTPQPGLNGRRGYQPRGKVLGGSSSINAMIYIRGHRSDYDGWAAAGNPGWAWDAVLPWFKRAEDNARGADAWHGQGGPLHVMDLCDPNPLSRRFVEAGRQAGWPENPDFNGAAFEGVGMYQVTHQNGERFSAAKGYLRPHLGRPNLQVFTEARAERLILDGRLVRGVDVLHRGQRLRLMARQEVALCAGAFQSPQLLMLSGVGDPVELQRHGITVRHALPGVGRNLHDHPDVVMVLKAPRARESFGLGLGGGWDIARAIGQWRRERRGLLTSNFAEAGGFFRSRPDEAVPDLQWHFVVGQLVNHGRSAVWGHGYSVHVCLLRPQSRGRVTLASADPLAAPVIDPAFLAEADDLDRLVSGVQQTRRLLAQPAMAALGGQEPGPLARAQDPQAIAEFIRNHADTIYHPVGSCRMGADPLAVVDAQMKVHGLSGLRVVDASAMPSIVSGNTNAPVIMMAERAAAWMAAARWRREDAAVIAPAPPVAEAAG